MESQRQEPPAYTSHDPDSLKLPEVPQQDLFRNHAPSDITLPNLKTVLADLPAKTVHPNALFNAAAREVHPMVMPAPPRASIESLVSPSDTASMMSIEDSTQRSTSVVSIEDPDVRLAAEALSGLGNPDFARSPKAHSLAGSQRSPTSVTGPSASRKDAEPLLNLLVDAHPWVGSTVNGSLSAYNATKNFSPRIVRFGVDLVERNVGSPMANTVSSIGRRTGVEGGIRRYLDSRRPASPADLSHGSKRRKVAADDMDIDQSLPELSLHESNEYLPAYQSNKPPSYREEVSPHGPERNRVIDRRHTDRSWSTKIFISTSALGVALSESSLSSLKFCVNFLTSATVHIETLLNALKMVLQEYDQTQESFQQDQARRQKESEAGFTVVASFSNEHDQASEILAKRIKSLCDGIWAAMQTVVNSVSKYAGGALPENARNIVKGQLLSLPQRWKWATQSAEAATSAQVRDKADGGEDGKPAEDDSRKAAHRMIAFANEGLDMISQVNDVVKITLESAENWLQSLGRRNREEEMMDADDTREPMVE